MADNHQLIDRTAAALAQAMASNNEDAAARHVIELLALALKDLNRLADAMERIASAPVLGA